MNGARSGVYQTGPSGTTLLAFERLDVARRDDVAVDLVQRGVRVGGTDGHAEVCWLFDDRGRGVWSSSQCAAAGTRSELRLANGLVTTDAVTRVASSIADGDLGRRDALR